jgi:hypothetical protein
MRLDNIDQWANSELQPTALKDCVTNGPVYEDAILDGLFVLVSWLGH